MRRNGVRILVVDDEPEMREPLADILTGEGYRVTMAENVSQAKKELRADGFFNILLTDLMLPDGTGLDLLEYVKRNSHETIVVILTGFASLETSIKAINAGVFSYLQKPVKVEEVKTTIDKALKVQKLSEDNKELLGHLKEMSLKDSLTHLYNYHYFLERFSSELKRAKRYIFPFSLIMIDVDHFKAINDVYGHSYGDIILKELAQYLNSFARGNDLVARYGGEEFMILLTDTNKEGAVAFGKRLWKEIGNRTFDSDGKKIRVKVSLGVVSYPEDGVDDEGTLLKLVDQALRDAKEAGGNRLSTPKRSKGSKKLEEIFIRKGGEGDVKILQDKLVKLGRRVNRSVIETVYAFARAVDSKDFYSIEHGEKITTISTAIGAGLGLLEKDMETLEHSAMLRDLGKVGIDNRLLVKKGKLTPEELSIVRKHPEIGHDIISPINSLEEIAPFILHHHEWFNGDGYPKGLKGKKIPLESRIIALADAYQALISDRSYRKAYSWEEALDIIVDEEKGSHFDPEVVEVFLKVIKKT